MTDWQTGAQPALTPSECVLAFGDRFAKPAGMLGDKEVVLTSGIKVDAADLATQAIAAAFLACEQAGAVRFEHRAGKALFGLMKTRSFVVLAGPGGAHWPAGSLEDWVVKGSRNETKVGDLAKGLINNEPVRSPALVMFNRLKGVMAARGVLHAESKTTLKVFTTVTYSGTDALQSPAAQAGAGAAKALLAGGQSRRRPAKALLAGGQSRADFWKELTQTIRSAINWMTQSSDT